MRKGKFSTRRSTGVKAMTMLLALVLAAGCVVGGTLAWLVDSTKTVENTFTTAGIEIDLTETFNTDTDGDNENDAWQAQMIPGYEYSKDPKVTVKANSVDCYLFVKFEESNTTYLTYTSNLVAPDWTQGTGTGEDGNGVPTNVWFRKVTSSTEDQSWDLLMDNKVAVNDTLEKGQVTADNAPKLTYTAYASQLYKSAGVEFSAKEAWNNVPKDTTK